MRTLVLLIVISALLIWFGVNYREAYRKYATISLVLGIMLAGLTATGFFGWW